MTSNLLLDKAQKGRYNKAKSANMFYHIFGALILLANKIRYSLFGYGRPRPFDVSQTDKAVNYDFGVFDGWMKHLKNYAGQNDIGGKNILELGPGADLGNAFIAIALGAATYTAFDANPLAKNCPDSFYDKLFDELVKKFGAQKDVLKTELEKMKKNENGRVKYVCDNKFDLSLLNNKFDLFFSQAAFEHFNDVGKVINQLSGLAAPGAIFLAEIDLQTHTQILRHRDPLNIYRFSDSFYRACHFAGIPNRVRPAEYSGALKSNGWSDITIVKLNALPEPETEKASKIVAKKIANDPDLPVLSFVLLAKK